MKQLFLFFTFFTVCCYSQSDIVVTVKNNFNPETKYTTEMKQFFNGSVEYIASDEILNRLKQNGLQNPMPVQFDQTFKTIMRTGKIKKDGFFPVKLLFIEKGNLATIPDDMVIYGKCKPGNLPVLDSITSAVMALAERNSMLTQMQSVFSQMSVPEKSARVGDSFTFDIPMTLPMAGKNIELAIKCIYTLKNITGDIADFDIITEFSLKGGIEAANAQIKGKGSGKLLYNWKLHYNHKYEVQSNFEMVIDIDQIKVNAKLTQGSIISVFAEKNS